MPVLNKIAYFRGIRNEVPNQALAKELYEKNNKEGVEEIVANLYHPEPNVQSDCLKVLYELGYLNPDMIVPYVEHFLELLKHKNNRMVWGAMIALMDIADKVPHQIFQKKELLKSIIDRGTVITRDAGLRALGKVAAEKPEYHKSLFPYILQYVKSCRPKDVARYAEALEPAVTQGGLDEYLDVLFERQKELSPGQQRRLKKIYQRLNVNE